MKSLVKGDRVSMGERKTSSSGFECRTIVTEHLKTYSHSFRQWMSLSLYWYCIRWLCDLVQDERRPQNEMADAFGHLARNLDVRLRLKCDVTRAETRFRLSRETDRVHLNRPGGVSSVDYWQPRCAASAVVMLDTACSEVVWRVLATHCIRQFPLHFPSRTSPCTITFQVESTNFKRRWFVEQQVCSGVQKGEPPTPTPHLLWTGSWAEHGKITMKFTYGMPKVLRNLCIIYIYLSGGFTAVAIFRKPNAIPLFLHWSGSKFLVVMAACTPSIHVFHGRPLFLLSRGIQTIINFGMLSSGILLTWAYHCSIFLSMMSVFPFASSISFICSFLFLPSLIFLLTSLAHPFL